MLSHLKNHHFYCFLTRCKTILSSSDLTWRWMVEWAQRLGLILEDKEGQSERIFVLSVATENHPCLFVLLYDHKKKATFRIVVHYNMSTFTCSTHISSTAAVLVRGRNCIFMTKVLFQDAAAYIRYSVISSIPFLYFFSAKYRIRKQFLLHDWWVARISIYTLKAIKMH